jgi:pSer/pThr/pTyr-binding forkhead associated (FHA) protein
MSLCPTCGATIRPQAQFCSICGAKVTGAVPALTVGNASAATILMPDSPQVNSATGATLITSNGQRIPVQAGTSIGREPHQNGVHIPDGRISRRHALLEEKLGQWLLTDLNSANGTYVNGRRITSPTPIQPGDQIQIGDTAFTLEISGRQSPGWGVHSFPSPPAPAPIPGIPNVPVPYGGWKSWQKPPLAEGRVEHIDRHTMKRDDLMQRGCVAVFLGLIAAPLAFLPFMQGSDLNVLNIRIADAHTPHMVDVKVMGDLYGVVSQGDIIAVWGQTQKGLFVMQRAYNYTTGHEITVKK